MEVARNSVWISGNQMGMVAASEKIAWCARLSGFPFPQLFRWRINPSGWKKMIRFENRSGWRLVLFKRILPKTADTFFDNHFDNTCGRYRQQHSQHTEKLPANNDHQ